MTFGLCQAQWTEQTYYDFDYHRATGINNSIALKNYFQIHDNFRMGIGYQATLHERHSINLLWQTDLLNTKKGTLYLENRYLYRVFPNYNMQEFNGLLDLGWENTHWNFQFGLCNRYIAEIPLRINGGMGTILEPMNVTFCVEGYLFDQQHPWNIGGRISNYRDFVIERFTLFFYSINGYYYLNDGLCLTAEAGVHPSGVLNLSAQYNGWFCNLGIIVQPQIINK